MPSSNFDPRESASGTEPGVQGILVDAVRYPITGFMLATALIVSIGKFNDFLIDRWVVSEVFLYSEPWRLFTSAFPHADPLHLLFNLYWMWQFGRIAERYLGAWRTALLYLTLGVGSSAAEFALFRGGIGLSGIVYGLLGFLWMRGSVDPRLRSAVDDRTLYLFGGWFLLCVVLTILDVWNVANVAHAAGALIGFLIGKRWWLRNALALVLIAFAASLFRPHINQSSLVGADYTFHAYQALIAEDNEHAEELSRRSIELNDESAYAWSYLGIALYRLGDYEAALSAFERTEELQPGLADEEILEWLRGYPR